MLSRLLEPRRRWSPAAAAFQTRKQVSGEALERTFKFLARKLRRSPVPGRVASLAHDFAVCPPGRSLP
jgi:hypothetical protein